MTSIQIICLVVVVLLAALAGFLIIKKSSEKKVLKLVALVVLTALLVCYTILCKKHFELMSVLVVVYLALLFGYLIMTKSENHRLAKMLLLLVLVAVGFTWIFSYGYFNAGEYMNYGMNQQGLTDLPNFIYYAFNFAGDKIVFLLSLGAFYAVLARSEGYKKLVTSIASTMEGKEIIFSLIISLLLMVITSFLSQTLAVLIFVPFLVSILLNMKLDKITAFAVTFGSILVGCLGAVYGGEALYWFNYYTETSVKTAIIYRLIVFVVGYVLFNLFMVLHVKKVLKNKKLNEVEDDPFAVEKVDKNAKRWPTVVLLCIFVVLIVLGYVSWNGTFGIEVFNKFHNWLMGLKIGNFQIFKAVFGTLAADANDSLKGAFGNWTLFHGATLMFVFSLLIAILNKIKLDELLDAYYVGIKRMLKPIAYVVGAYMVLVAAYFSPFMPTITNMLFKKVSAFNPYLVSFAAFVSNLFHADLGFTAYTVAGSLMNTYATNVEVIHIIFTTLFGFVGLIAPTSLVLVIGLSYLKIDYKAWIKYIWIFVLSILAILLILFTIMTYV